MAKKKSSNSRPTLSGVGKAQERRWEIESAISTLQRADQIRKDASLMREVKKSVMDLQKSIVGAPMKGKTNNKKK